MLMHYFNIFKTKLFCADRNNVHFEYALKPE
jgi:hypothetical protein